MPSAVGFGVLAAHLFCGFVVRFCSHLPRKAKNLRLPFSATGGSRLHVARLWRACLPLANYPMNTNICSLSKPVPPRGGMGETSPVSLGVMGECRGGLRGALRKSPWPHSAKKEDGSSPSSFKKQNSNSPAFALPQPFFQSLLFHGIQSKFTTLQHQ